MSEKNQDVTINHEQLYPLIKKVHRLLSLIEVQKIDPKERWIAIRWIIKNLEGCLTLARLLEHEAGRLED